MLSPKRVHDAKEVFDGVPSLHDAKSCVVMAQLHRQGVSRAYTPMHVDRVRMRALVSRREVFEKPLQMHLGALEGLLGRRWPELLGDMDVWRRQTPLELLAVYPCPADVLAHEAGARAVMRRASRNSMKPEDVQRVFDSASRSIGLPASEEEREVIRAVVLEALHVRASISSIDKVIEKVATEHETTRGLAPVVGRVTAVVLVAYLGPFSEYGSAAALEKACGLNLKIKSSGNVIGRPSITRRGPPEVRMYLCAASREERSTDRRMVPIARRLPREPQAHRGRWRDAQARACLVARCARRDLRRNQARRCACSQRCVGPGRSCAPAHFARRLVSLRGDRRALI